MDPSDLVNYRGMKVSLDASEEITFVVVDPPALLGAAEAMIATLPEDQQEAARAQLAQGPLAWATALYRSNAAEMPGIAVIHSGRSVGAPAETIDLSGSDPRQRVTVRVGIELEMIIDDWDAFHTAVAERVACFMGTQGEAEAEMELLRTRPADMVFQLLEIDAIADRLPGLVFEGSVAINNLPESLF